MADALAFSLMVGSGELYLPAFALALAMGETVTGLLASLPLLVGSLLQLVSPRMVRRLGSYRRWVVLCSLLQALVFIPLVAAAIGGQLSVPGIFLLAAIYWGAVLATGPAWNTWVEELVPKTLRPRFFARRSRLGQLGLLIGLIGGGALLDAGERQNRLFLAFAGLFAVAGIARLLSALFLSRQSEEPGAALKDRSIAVRGWLAKVRHGPDGKLLLYLLATQTAVYVAAPYFTPYMLGDLRMSYASYMGLLSVALLAKIISLPSLGAFARRFGVHRLLWFGGIGIVPMSVLWLFSDNFLYLCAAQTVSGITWAAYELATVLMFFEAIRPEERVSVLTMFNVANAGALVLGSTVGGLLLHGLGEARSAYFVLFGLSFALRGMSLLLLPRAARISRVAVPVAIGALTVRASTGAVARPVLPGLPER
jgi:MFS family permease